MKLNLLKKLLTLSPVVISPILVTACGSSDNDNKTNVINPDGQFYLDFYQRELNAVWSTQTAAINTAANSPGHEYDLPIKLLGEVLTKVKTDGAAEFKKEFPGLDNYDPSNFSDVTISFSIPDDSKGNLKIANDGVLSVYPATITNGVASEKHINYTLKLNSAKMASKEISGSLKFNLQAKFVAYNGSSLPSNDVWSVFGNADMSQILVGTLKGLGVGAKQANGGYKFDNYTTSGSGSSKLKENTVLCTFGDADLSTILVGENYGGVDIGAKQANGKYDFTNYGTGQGLKSSKVFGVYGNANMSTILLGQFSGGLDVGTKQAGGGYKFDNYSSGVLKSNRVYGVYGSTDMSTILVGEQNGGGLDVGTRASASAPYTFTNYSTSTSSKIGSNNVACVYGNADLSTILVGENGGGLDVGTRDKASDPYTFTNYDDSSSSNLVSNNIASVYGTPDMSTILLGENGDGLTIGTKQADGNYTFANYNSAAGLASSYIKGVYGSTDMSTILVGGNQALDISSNLWFA